MWKPVSMLALSLWIQVAPVAQSPNLIFRHITRSNGLPVDAVKCLAQDSSGFIWIGSNEGLFRYDGLNYKAYSHDPTQKNTIPSGGIIKICVARNGQLWIATWGGLILMSRNGDVVRLINSSNSAYFTKQSDEVTDVKEDSKGNIWASTYGGLFRLSRNGLTIERFDLDSFATTYNRFLSLFIDPGDNIWTGTHSGIKVFDRIKQRLVSIADPQYGFTGPDKETYCSALFLQENKLWYTTWKPNLGVFDVTLKKNTYIYSAKGDPNPDYNRMANAMYKDSKRALWIATGRGLQLYNPGDKNGLLFLHESVNPYSLIDDHVNAILEDCDGDLWLGTDEGISITRPYNQYLYNFSVNDTKRYPFGDHQISDVMEADSNRLLVGTNGGKGLFLTDNNFNIQKNFFFNNASYDWIWKHYTDWPRRQIFISTQDGLLVYDQQKASLRIEKKGLFNNWHSISSFVAMSDSVLWVSRFQNMFRRYDLNTGQFTEYSLTGAGQKLQNITLSIDRDSKLWVLGSDEGLFQIDERNGKIVQHLEATESEQSLRQTQIYVFLDLGDQFLIGYSSEGISLYDKRTKKYEHFNHAQGLPGSGVREAVLGIDGSVWIATSNGISQFDPVRKIFRNYGFEDGVLNTRFISIMQLKDGRIVAGSTKGLTVIDPAKIPPTSRLPHPPIFTNINMYGKNIVLDSINDQHPLRVSYKRNYFSIDYVSPQYNNSRQLQYACMLEGLDDDWLIMENRRSIAYANIKGGNYVFRVKVREPGGDWVESALQIPIFVQAAFYTQGWFFLSVGLILAGLIYLVFRYRVKQLLRLEQMRSSISSDLHDEVGSSLTSISIFSEMAKQGVTPSSKEGQYLQRIGDRSRESIEKMSDIIWSINPNSDSLEQMLTRMKNYTSEMAEAKDIAIHWEESGNLPDSKLSMGYRKNIYLFYKESINNIIKHAQAKNIYILLQSQKNGILLRVRDDGAGFDHSAVQRGNGLKNMKKRAELLNASFKIMPGNTGGTAIELFILH